MRSERIGWCGVVVYRMVDGLSGWRVSVAKAGEFGLIARVTARLASGPSVLLGPGDDAAVVSAPDGRVVASTDVLVEGRHFRRDWSTAVDIGHRAAAANLADIAAMGAAADRAAGRALRPAGPGGALGRGTRRRARPRRRPWSARAWSAVTCRPARR